MIIKIRENELKQMIREALDDLVNAYQVDTSSIYAGCNSKILKENLIVTYAPGKLKRIINRNPTFQNIGITNVIGIQKDDDFTHPIETQRQFNNVENNNTFQLDYLYHFKIEFKKGFNCDIKTLKYLIEFMKKCGWYFMCVVDYNDNFKSYKMINNEVIRKVKSGYLLFEPDYVSPKDVFDIPDICYHVTPLSLLPNILKKGLKPMNKGREVNHQARTYLFLNDYKWKEDIVKAFRKSGSDEPHVLLEVYMKRLKNTIKFYPDTNFMNGHPAIYTLECIPNNFINVKARSDE